jgi:hypothetical protein
MLPLKFKEFMAKEFYLLTLIRELPLCSLELINYIVCWRWWY